MEKQNSEDVAKYYKRKQIESATPGQLIVLLYDGAIERINLAEAALEIEGPKRIEAFHTNIVRAQEIIAELMSALDMEKGGEIAANLYRLYDFMHYRLIDSNMSKEAEPLQEVRDLLTDLRNTWVKVVAEEPLGNKAPPPKQQGLNIKG